MSYRQSEGTGSGQGESRNVGPVIVRKLTESQGSRSEVYEVAEQTGRVKSRRTASGRAGELSAPEELSNLEIAANEHVRRLVRRAAEAAQALYETDDVRDAALLGSTLHATISELWQHRQVRELDWAEAVNLLQIVFAGEDFETLSAPRRRVISRIFEEGLLTRTVARAEMARILQLLTEGGFDPWKGTSEIETGE